LLTHVDGSGILSGNGASEGSTGVLSIPVFSPALPQFNTQLPEQDTSSAQSALKDTEKKAGGALDSAKESVTGADGAWQESIKLWQCW